MIPALLGLGIWVSPNSQAQAPRLGFNQVECPAASDTVVSVPLQRTPVLLQSQAATVAAAAGAVTVTPILPPSWGAGSLADSHYVRWLTGPHAGRWYAIQGNTAAAITLDTQGDTAEHFQAGHAFSLIEYWTLDALFPPGVQTAIHVSAGTFPHQYRTQVLLFNQDGNGINRPADKIFILTESGWRAAAAGNAPAGSTRLPPGSRFIIRHPPGVAATVFLPHGRVVTGPDVLKLAPDPAARRDHHLSLQRPVPVNLESAGLTAPAFIPSTSHAPASRADELITFDNAAAAFNKPPKHIYYRVGAAWFRDAGLQAANPRAESDVVFPPASGVILRKAPAAGGSQFWTNPAPYLNP